MAEPKKRPPRWKRKEYSLALLNKANLPVKAEEKELYDSLMTQITEKNKITQPQDMMLTHNAVFDFLRVLRVQKIIIDEGDITTLITKGGNKIRKAHEASYLLNSIQTQLRQGLKELMLTRKEQTKKILGSGKAQDITQFMEIEAEVLEQKTSNVQKSTTEDEDKKV